MKESYIQNADLSPSPSRIAPFHSRRDGEADWMGRRCDSSAFPSGFTLIEVIASLALAGILAAALLTLVVTAMDGFVLSRFAADTTQKAQLALTRIRLELIETTAVTTADPDQVVFSNPSGTYVLQRSSGSITLEKTAPAAIPAKPLVDNIAVDYEGDVFLSYATASGTWTAADDLVDLFAITVTLKFEDFDQVFQTDINPRINTLRNAPRLL